jgi:hypothetical protein
MGGRESGSRSGIVWPTRLPEMMSEDAKFALGF